MAKDAKGEDSKKKEDKPEAKKEDKDSGKEKESDKDAETESSEPESGGILQWVNWILGAVLVVLAAYFLQKLLVPPDQCTEANAPVRTTDALPMSKLARAYYNNLQKHKQIDVPDQKFMLYDENLKGFGNKLRGLSSLMLLAIQYERILLIGTSFDWLRDFFRQPPSMHPWSLEEAKIMNTIQLQDDRALAQRKTTPVPFMPSNLKQWVKAGSYDRMRWWSAQWMDVSTSVFKDWPEAGKVLNIPNGTERFKECAANPKDFECRGELLEMPLLMQVSRLFAEKPSTEFRNAIAKLKKELDWESYDLSFGLHLRMCTDCAMKGEDWIKEIVVCMKDKIQAEMSSFAWDYSCGARAVLYIATDSPEHIQAVEEGLGGIIKIVSQPNSSFVHTAKGGEFEKMLPPMLDWWMLGETDIAFSGMMQHNYVSTFFTSAVGRFRTRETVIVKDSTCKITKINTDAGNVEYKAKLPGHRIPTI
mmetsp:Transcript_51583/g.104999  ORF Transcript_51583/g.104999 Transcript_51583/m.104999 type:complete len:475 (+) Transcript_51583:38-1462(+)